MDGNDKKGKLQDRGLPDPSIAAREREGIMKLLEAAEKERFWGDIIIRFQGGQIGVIYKNQALKPKDILNLPSGITERRGQ